MKEFTIRLPSIPDEFKNLTIWKLILGLICCGLILAFVFPPLYLVILLYERLLMKKGILQKGMNYEKVFRGI